MRRRGSGVIVNIQRMCSFHSAPADGQPAPEAGTDPCILRNTAQMSAGAVHRRPRRGGSIQGIESQAVPVDPETQVPMALYLQLLTLGKKVATRGVHRIVLDGDGPQRLVFCEWRSNDDLLMMGEGEVPCEVPCERPMNGGMATPLSAPRFPVSSRGEARFNQ